MYQQNALNNISPATCCSMQVWGDELSATPLAEEHKSEVLAFLSQRPIHTVAMVGFIRDNGLVSELNRGTFYGCRNRQGQLEGVALIGHSTLLETRTVRAVQAFATIAKNCTRTHMIMGEEQRIAEFWKYYAEGGQELRKACCEVLFELQWPVEVQKEVVGLRLATLADLPLIMPVHAQMSFGESGINPLEKDPVGFERRCARRVQQERTFVWVEDGKLLFKADIMSDTPDTIYLEGIWASPKIRGNGDALRCLSQLARTLLGRCKSICLLSNVENKTARNFYQKAGFKVRGIYDTIFVEANEPSSIASTSIN